MGFARRHILAGLGLLALSACAVESIRAPGDTEALDVRAVAVNTDDVRVFGRPIELTRSQIGADFEAALTAALASASSAGATPVAVTVALSALELAPPVERTAGATSSATGTVTVTEVGTGRVIVPATEVTGNTENFRGALWVGLLTTRSVDKDYTGTVNGFADTIRQTIFGSDT